MFFGTSINEHLFSYSELNNEYVIIVTSLGPFLKSGRGSITPKITPWDFMGAMVIRPTSFACFSFVLFF